MMDDYRRRANPPRYGSVYDGVGDDGGPWVWIGAIVLMVAGVIVLHANQDQVLLRLSKTFPSLEAKLPPELRPGFEGNGPTQIAVGQQDGYDGTGTPHGDAPSDASEQSDGINEDGDSAARPEIKMGRLLKRRRGPSRGVAVMLRWTRVRGAEAYHVQLSRNPTFSPTIIDTEVGQPRLLKKRMRPAKYFCRTRAKTHTDYGPFSEVFQLSPGAAAPPSKRRGTSVKGKRRTGKRRRGRTRLASSLH